MLAVKRIFELHLIICMMLILSIVCFEENTAEQNFNPEAHKNWENFDHKHCGISHTKRIIGGKDAHLGEYPWITLIGNEDYAGVVFSCGGALLNRYYVVTAEHCVGCEDCEEEKEPPNLIRAGEHNLGSLHDCSWQECAPPAQDRGVAEIYRIENQNPWPHNDIALIKVSNPFVINDFVMPVCLPDEVVMRLNFIGSPGILAGWGTISNYVKMTHMVLQKLRVQVLHQEECAEVYHEFNRTTQMCASGKVMTGACNGDSGGPLVLRVLMKGRPHFVLVGVVSYGPKVCSTGPTVFTKITVNLRWILDNITTK